MGPLLKGRIGGHLPFPKKFAGVGNLGALWGGFFGGPKKKGF